MEASRSFLSLFLLLLVLGCSAGLASASTISIQEDDVDLCCTSGNTVNVLTENSGTVSCLNYTDNLNCTWLILPQNGLAPISFEVSEISTEECCDHLTAFDGPASDFPVLLEVSGTNFGFPVHSSESYLTVVFTSDSSNSGGNFTFSYSSGACLANNFLTPQTFAITDGKGYGTAYPPNLECQWVINSTEPVEQITFYFEKLDLDPTSTVTITDAIDGTVIGVYSNNSHVDPIVVNASNANVEFRSGPNGGASSHQGFNLTYTAGSCQPWVNYQNLNGSFTDGSGTQDYFNNLNCSFLITPSNFDSRNLITISVPFIDIEEDDHVYIYDGPDASYELLATYSGNIASVPVYASSGSAFVEFISDASVSYDGFVAEYTTNSCLNQTYWYAASATFEDGSGPAFNYTAGVQCSWNILPFDPVVNLTTLYFTHLDLGAGDSISIYSADTGALVEVVKGNASTLDQIPVDGGNVTVMLNSVSGGKGFNLAYAAGSCLPHVVFTSNNGTFTAGQGDGAEYFNNLDCQFVIQPTSLGVPQRSNNQRLGIVFDFVDTEQGDDYVAIYDGPSPLFPQIALLSGSLEKQGPYFAKEGVLTVIFHSDGSNGGLGFQAVYSVE